MTLSDKSQMSLMKRDKPSMNQKGPRSMDVCDPKQHVAKPLSDSKQLAGMKRKGR